MLHYKCSIRFNDAHCRLITLGTSLLPVYALEILFLPSFLSSFLTYFILSYLTVTSGACG